MNDKEYIKLSEELQKRIMKDRNIDKAPDPAIRRDPTRDKANLWRPAFVRDVEKILHCPYYNRYSDKTQVFTFYKNDDISRRALHVQLVSRIARNIGYMLGLDLDLIEAIALGHDIGHTPFGHAGERMLDKVYYEHSGRHFRHNIQSVRVLDTIFGFNVSLQTLDGIICHNGEFAMDEYRPAPMPTWEQFDARTEKCILADTTSHSDELLVPATLEGCVVRISDMIAYIGKDRQDAVRTKLLADDFSPDSNPKRHNASIINNMIVNIVENSYGKDYIKLDSSIYSQFEQSKYVNYEHIYKNPKVSEQYEILEPLFSRLYEKCLRDLKNEDESSIIYRHHIKYLQKYTRYYAGNPYLSQSPESIVTDYIASMTDDYFVELCEQIFPDSPKIRYIPYFDEEED